MTRLNISERRAIEEGIDEMIHSFAYDLRFSLFNEFAEEEDFPDLEREYQSRLFSYRSSFK